MFELINVFATQQFRSLLIVYISFVIDCNWELKLAQTARINQLLQLLNLMCIYTASAPMG